VRDLLEPSDASLSVRESGKRGVFVDGLSQAQVTKEEEAPRLAGGRPRRRLSAPEPLPPLFRRCFAASRPADRAGGLAPRR